MVARTFFGIAFRARMRRADAIYAQEMAWLLNPPTPTARAQYEERMCSMRRAFEVRKRKSGWSDRLTTIVHNTGVHQNEPFDWQLDDGRDFTPPYEP